MTNLPIRTMMAKNCILCGAQLLYRGRRDVCYACHLKRKGKR